MQRTSAAQIYVPDGKAINKHSINGMFDYAAFAPSAMNAANGTNSAINGAAATESVETVSGKTDHLSTTPFAQSRLQQVKQAIIKILNGDSPGQAVEALQSAMDGLSDDQISTLLHTLGPEFENRQLDYLWEIIADELELDTLIPNMSSYFSHASDTLSNAATAGDLVDRLKERSPTPSTLGKISETLEKMRQGRETQIKMDCTNNFDTPKPQNAHKPPAYMLAHKPPAQTMPAPALAA